MKRMCVVLAVIGLACGLQAADAPEQGVHATLTLKVASFQESLRAIQDLAAGNGLRVSSTALESTQKGRKHGWVKLDVPTEQVDATLASLNSLGKTVESSRWSDDLGWQKLEVSARLSRVKDHADRLQGLLQGRNLRVRDKMYLYDRLFQNGTDQDALARDLVSIEGQAKRASINITLFEPYLPTESAPAVTGPRKTLAGLRSQLATITTDAAAWFVQTAVRLLVYSPIWLPALLLTRRWLRKYLKSG